MYLAEQNFLSLSAAFKFLCLVPTYSDMKQNMLIQVSSMNNNKSRSKALKIAGGLSGVESVALKGNEKNQIEVEGDGIDAVELTRLLRKNVGFAELIKVGPVDERKGGGGENKSVAATQQPPVIYSYPAAYEMPQYQTLYEVGAPYHEPSCTIL